MQSLQQAGQPQPRKPARFRRALVGLGCGALFLILGYALTWEEKPKTPKAQAATVPVTHACHARQVLGRGEREL